MAIQEAGEAKEEAETAGIVGNLLATLGPNVVPSDKQEAIRLGLEHIQKDPRNRRLAMLTARLQRELGDYEAALATLRAFVDRKRRERQLDSDYADALYNIACYETKVWEAQGDDNRLTAALEALRESVSIAPRNKIDAAVDNDFNALRGNREFLTITRR